MKTHLTHYLSSLNFNFEPTLIYMLQRVDYDPKKYYRDLRKVRDFNTVMGADGKMEPTLVAHLLFRSLALKVLIYVALVFWFAIWHGSIWAHALGILLILAIPLWAQYAIAWPLLPAKRLAGYPGRSGRARKELDGKS